VRVDSRGVPQLALSRNGTLAYVIPIVDALMWVNRLGEYEVLPTPPQGYGFPRISPDGRTAAVGIAAGGSSKIHLYDLARDVLAPLAQQGNSPVWTPDGRRVVFSSFIRGGDIVGPEAPGLYWASADGRGDSELLLAAEPDVSLFAYSWSPDGTRLAYMAQDERGEDIWVLTLSDEPVAEPFLDSPAREHSPAFSPDGQWMAYVSDESGRDEVYVRRYPAATDRTLVSRGGGVNPRWSRDGRELFYRQVGAGIFVVPITTAPELTLGPPQHLFHQGDSVDTAMRQVPYGERPFNWGSSYDVSPDGERLLMVLETEPESLVKEVAVVMNWAEELQERVPVP
jgi:dipeptidyl aminopeptidase/acylaminoacyl peptidase